MMTYRYTPRGVCSRDISIEVAEDGTPREQEVEKPRLALIAPEDFLKNQPDYQDIAPVEGFDGEFVC